MKAKIIKLIEEHYSDPNFDVNKLAEKLGICRDYLNTVCQYKLDCTAHNFIESVRIGYAKKLLLEGCKIIEVCKKTGYSNKRLFT